MNNLLSRLSQKYTEYKIDDIEIRVKSISYAQFDAYKNHIEAIPQDASDTDKLFSNVSYIVENFITNSANERLIDPKMLKDLPIDFIIALLSVFNTHIEKLFVVEKKL